MVNTLSIVFVFLSLVIDVYLSQTFFLCHDRVENFAGIDVF